MRRHSASAARNQDAVCALLQRSLPRGSGFLLELASGSGQHIAHFASRLPLWTLQPTDLDPTTFPSILAYAREARLDNVLPPHVLDASKPPWQMRDVDVVLVVNMIHISPWPATEGLMQGARMCLKEGGRLVVYGPFQVDGESDDSNQRFDQSLRERNQDWGVRALTDVKTEARVHGLRLICVYRMPRGNLGLVFEKQIQGEPQAEVEESWCTDLQGMYV